MHHPGTDLLLEFVCARPKRVVYSASTDPRGSRHEHSHSRPSSPEQICSALPPRYRHDGPVPLCGRSLRLAGRDDARCHRGRGPRSDVVHCHAPECASEVLNESVALGTIARPGLAFSFSPSVDLPPWLTQGEPTPCLRNPDLFFPEDYGLRYREQIEDARRACDFCPMRETCLGWAVPRPNLDGIWAATTPPERRRIRTGKAA